MQAARQLGTDAGRLCGALAFTFLGLAHPPEALAQTAEIRLVALASASGSDTVTTLPTSSTQFLNDASFVVEVWAQTTDARGLSSVSADIAFTGTLASVTNITHSATFNVLTAGTINNANGTIDNLSGSHLGPCSDAVAVSPNWARVAILNVSASASGTMLLQAGPTGSAIYGTAICGVGNMADAQIVFGSVSVDLVECLADGDCDDGQFCNGAETCNLTTFTCQPGTPPSCDDGIACTVDVCDPLANGGAGGCVHTPDHAFCDDLVACTDDACDQLAGPGVGCSNAPNHANCDNLLFCDGAETCDAIQGCLDGLAPCAADCEHCVESTDACELCILDLDGSGVMGTGDFSFFAPCFGACYSAGHPCLDSNFDGDVGGCVGTSDFAAFVGCFGFTCGQCSGCVGPGGGGAMASTAVSSDEPDPFVVVRLVARHAPSLSDLLDAPPQSETVFAVGEQVYLEVWAAIESAGRPAGMGLASAFVDVHFDAARLALVDIVPSDEFGLLTTQSATLDDGVLHALGGCTQLRPEGAGADGNWVRFTTVVTRAVTPGQTRVLVGSSDQLHGFSRVGMFENIESSWIDFNAVTVDVHKKIRRARGER